MLNVRGSISAKTGFAPTLAMDPADATNVNGVVITSSERPISRASNAKMSASEPDAQLMQYLQPETVPTSFSKASTDRKSTRLNSSHGYISYAVFCLKE